MITKAKGCKIRRKGSGFTFTDTEGNASRIETMLGFGGDIIYQHQDREAVLEAENKKLHEEIQALQKQLLSR